jgi:hypothetical protein
VLHRARGLLRLNQADLAVFLALPLYAQYSPSTWTLEVGCSVP